MRSQMKTRKFPLTLLLAIMLALAVTPALQAQQVRLFSATIAPTTVNAGATDLYTITITNDATSTKEIHTAKVIVPAGFTGVAITTPNPITSDGKAWTAALVGTEIRLSASGGTNKLLAGQSVAVSFNATAPGTAGPYEWTTSAYQADDWIDTPFTLTGPQPMVTVVGVYEGLSHGYWKNHTEDWPATGFTTGQTLESVFDIPDSFGLDDVTLLQALDFLGGNTLAEKAQILLRNAVASVLNAADPDINYPLTLAEVIEAVNAALASMDADIMLALEAELDEYNNLGLIP